MAQLVALDAYTINRDVCIAENPLVTNLYTSNSLKHTSNGSDVTEEKQFH